MVNFAIYGVCKFYYQIKTKILDRDRTRTCNPQIRSLMPYPLGHTATDGWLIRVVNYKITKNQNNVTNESFCITYI